MRTIAIIGSGITGNLAAMYFCKRLPEVKVVVIGRHDRARPLVGESTVEITTHFLKGLGLSQLLEERHYHKYGLTYYFKLSTEATCRKYVVHEAPGVIRMPAYNLNRWSFDRDIRRINDDIGVMRIDADVSDVELNVGVRRQHRLSVKQRDESMMTLDVDWIIDASGRNRFLARKLDLKKEPTYQRSTFWFRLKSFDRTALENIDAVRVAHHCFDPYYVTHHFYGRGYWIWAIPMRSETGEDLVSIGITYRPDLHENDVTSVDDFLERVALDHPVLCDLVRSGVVHDTNSLRNYMYESKKYYSTDGWFLIGDAAFTFDPANSAGLAYVAQEIPQVAAMIKKDMDGDLHQSYVDCLEAHIQAQLALQDMWSNWYEFMHDPLRMAWTLLLSNMAYFHILLPTYVNGGFLDGNQARQFAELLPRFPRDAQPPAYPFSCLLDAIAESNQNVSANLLPNLYSRSVNFDLYRADEAARPRYVARYFWLLTILRLRLMRFVKWRPTYEHLALAFRQLVGAGKDATRAMMLRIRPSLFYKYGASPPRLASPFEPEGGFLRLQHHGRGKSPPLDAMRSDQHAPCGITARERSCPEVELAK
ncbi:tryptophan 7-halogenase [Paraburkholderia sp. Ac-20347]|uniref:NAD(P)/FAD-dependent oxidoreductase n=1 Tax=Paraburkholderia sp. Ac-20347 TaxID=2703892 RepID=UPI0019812360|nr:tryptophan 7-halogenase [Paraburkholderia sp. Ac-20347]MBN3811320.1 NAD(P)/FAD-dependent oxidoreductase [Paraburkholderia sp. Ac-20347]